jgi:hypothetical protein
LPTSTRARSHTPGSGIGATEVSAARGPDALAAVFDALANESSVPRPSSAREAWTHVRRSFEELERALMAQATPGAPRQALMDYSVKAKVAWRLLAQLSWLLVLLDAEAPETMEKLRSEVAEMDRAAR